MALGDCHGTKVRNDNVGFPRRALRWASPEWLCLETCEIQNKDSLWRKQRINRAPRYRWKRSKRVIGTCRYIMIDQQKGTRHLCKCTSRNAWRMAQLSISSPTAFHSQVKGPIPKEIERPSFIRGKISQNNDSKNRDVFLCARSGVFL